MFFKNYSLVIVINPTNLLYPMTYIEWPQPQKLRSRKPLITYKIDLFLLKST
ncbi:MAG: hypothetical protein ACI815_001067 [Psychroserpens sp.]|jgi:hypothetical protein